MKEDKSLAMALIDETKNQSKRKDIIIIIVIIAWVLSLSATVWGFLWYMNQFDYSSDTTEEYTNTTDGGGNACIGDNCNNGDSV